MKKIWKVICWLFDRVIYIAICAALIFGVEFKTYGIFAPEYAINRLNTLEWMVDSLAYGQGEIHDELMCEIEGNRMWHEINTSRINELTTPSFDVGADGKLILRGSDFSLAHDSTGTKIQVKATSGTIDWQKLKGSLRENSQKAADETDRKLEAKE